MHLAITRKLTHVCFFHAKHAAVKATKTTISSSDTVTDVVVLAISVFIDLHINKLWIAFGKEKDFRWIPVHQMKKALGPRCIALPFVHAFKGCDRISAFVEKEKRHEMCFKLLLRNPLVSVLQSAQLQTTSVASLKNLW